MQIPNLVKKTVVSVSTVETSAGANVHLFMFAFAAWWKSACLSGLGQMLPFIITLNLRPRC